MFQNYYNGPETEPQCRSTPVKPLIKPIGYAVADDQSHRKCKVEFVLNFGYFFVSDFVSDIV